MKFMAALLIIGLCSAGVGHSMQSSAPDSSTQKLIGTWKLTAFEDRPVLVQREMEKRRSPLV